MSKLKYKQGDLLQAFKQGDVNIIAHCCNCFNTMGAGIARAIAKEFPEAEDVDNNTTKGNKAKLGSYSAAYTKHGFIFNLYGQYFYGYGKNINYLALKDSLQRMVEFLQEARIGSVKIGIPKLGCGLAGGDWHAVENIIQETIGDFDVTVYTLEG